MKTSEGLREGRRGEFAVFAAFEDPERRAEIPDPNGAYTVESSIPTTVGEPELGAERRRWLTWASSLLAVRHANIIPRLPGCKADSARVLSDKAVSARWRMGDGNILAIAIKLGDSPVSCFGRASTNGARLLIETPGAAEAICAEALIEYPLLAHLIVDQSDA